jgi:hypothetical protein
MLLSQPREYLLHCSQKQNELLRTHSIRLVPRGHENTTTPSVASVVVLQVPHTEYISNPTRGSFKYTHTRACIGTIY